ncbi:Histidine kinase-, DNA gyrase B-, and HSP90-like ATPase [Cupriavidus sp. YR651]|uniref:ATP-binding protein n=1 Tax=Cupriavidus sp. YR651 TaxID=1855315 RepID=UPI0008847481|nr:ATP-binding protein [Cupriavidus sp. YR651]SDD22248.1 Histidine kinase-, DNA gyrase B-, and HSP90-like ATPase [Cupriavidus sp. YR651]
MDGWDPLDIQGSATSEIVAASKKREIRNILKSYVGFFDPFSELIQNALDAVDLRAATVKSGEYRKKLWIKIDLKENALTVIDNGIGFSEPQFRTFLSPSISFKNSNQTRGNKGVGATYLAYGFNELEIETRSPDFFANTKFVSGREWVEDNDAIVARPTVQVAPGQSVDFLNVDQGTRFTLKFRGNVRPKNLGWIGASTAEQWKYLLLIKTPLGQITRQVESDVVFDLTVVDSNGGVTEISNHPCAYVFPHSAIKACVRISDFTKEQAALSAQGKDASKLPPKFKKLNAVYEYWGKDDLVSLVSSDEDRSLIDSYGVWAYGFFCYSAVQVFDRFNDETAKLRKGQRVLRGGLQLATNSMPQGELITIPLTSNIGYQNQAHVVVHLSNADPDLGRKGFQPELQKLSEKLSVSIVNRLKQWRNYMLTDSGPGTSHQEDLSIDEWINSQREYEKAHPINLKNPNFFVPINEISITAEPNSEQDVVSLFNQLVAGGVIRGIKLMATSSHKQYDGLYRYHLNQPLENHRYDEVSNPLGVENIKMPADFVSKPYVLEFKHGFDSLMTDFDNGEKSESSINLAIVWKLQKRFAERYQVVSLLHPDNIHLRQFHGVTHELHDDHTGEKRMDVIVLSDLISYLNDVEKEIANQEMIYMQ